MVWPRHLRPLPALISSPWKYINIVYSSSSSSIDFCTVKHFLYTELGNTEHFWKLLLHVSKDVLLLVQRSVEAPDNKLKPEMEEGMYTLARYVISSNHPDSQAELKERFSVFGERKV